MHAPLIESAPPTIKAIRALGILIVQNIESSMGSMPSGVPLPLMWPPIIPKRSLSEIYTLPCLIARSNIKRHRTADIAIFSPVPFLVMILLAYELSEYLLKNVILDIIERLCEVAELISIDGLAPFKCSLGDVLIRT